MGEFGWEVQFVLDENEHEAALRVGDRSADDGPRDGESRKE